MARRGGVRSTAPIEEIKRLIAQLPKYLKQEGARRVAEKATELTLRAYDSGRQVDGSLRPLGVRGNKLTLVKTGETRRGLRWVGRRGQVILIAAGATQYIAKYGILPDAKGIPQGWRRHFAIILNEVLRGLVTK